MKSKYLFSFGLLALLLGGCGGSSNPSTSEGEISQKDGIYQEDDSSQKEVETIIGHVIDSPIWGLSYSCTGQKSLTTDQFGTFECESLPVTFKVGDLVVGHVATMPKDEKIYPQDIIGVSRDKVEDKDVVVLTRFFQTLDDDGVIDESIKIKPSLAKEFTFKEETELTTLDEVALNSMLQDKIGKDLVGKEAAQKHLRKNLVDGKTPVDIELSLVMPDIPKGLDGKAVVNGIYRIEGGEVKSILSKDVTYTSGDKSIATIDSDGKITALREGNVAINAKYGNLTAQSDLHVTHTSLTRIEIEEPTIAQLTSLALGKGAYFRVKGFYSAEGIEKDVTKQVVWSSKSPLLSNIYATGNWTGSPYNISASGEGNASLLATVFDLSDKVEFAIQKSDITHIGIHVKNVELPLGKRMYLYNASLLGYYVDDSNTSVVDRNVTWSVDDENVLEKSGDSFIAKEKGEATLSAKYLDFEDSVKITVVDPVIESISLYIQDYSLHIGDKTNVHVRARYTDGKEEDMPDNVILKNLNPTIFSITSDGNITALKGGQGTLEAIYVGKDKNVTAMQYIYVQKPYVEPIATAITITTGTSDAIRLGSGIYLSLKVTYDQQNPGTNVVTGGTENFYVGTGSTLSDTYTDRNGVTWTVDDSSIAAFYTPNGRYLKGLKTGEVTVTAKLGNLTTSKTLKVVGPTSVEVSMESSDELALNKSKTLTLVAIYSDGVKQTISSDDVYWEVDDSSIAKLNVSYNASLEGIKKGEVTVTAKYLDLTATSVIKVVGPTDIAISFSGSDEIPFGSSKRLSFQAMYADGSKQSVNQNDIYWEVDDSTIAKLDVGYYDASLQAIQKGEVMVTAKYGDLSTSKIFKVIDPIFESIQIEPAYNSSVFIGMTKQFKVIARYSDGSQKDINESVTWQVMSNIATVTEDGKVTGISEGTTRLKATYQDKSVLISINVQKVELSYLRATNERRDINVNETVQLQVVGYYNDGTEKEIIKDIVWTSEDESIVTVESSGKVTAKKSGETIVKADVDGKSANFYIFVKF